MYCYAQKPKPRTPAVQTAAAKILCARFRLLVSELLIERLRPTCKFDGIRVFCFFPSLRIREGDWLIKIGHVFGKIHAYCPGNINTLKPRGKICSGPKFFSSMRLLFLECFYKGSKLFRREVPKGLVIHTNGKCLHQPYIVNNLPNRSYFSSVPLSPGRVVCLVESA